MDKVGDVLKDYYLIPKNCRFTGITFDDVLFNKLIIQGNELNNIIVDRVVLNSEMIINLLEFIEESMITYEEYKDIENLKVYDGIQKSKILNQEQQEEIKKLRDAGYKIKDLCKKFKVSESTIRRVLKNEY